MGITPRTYSGNAFRVLVGLSPTRQTVKFGQIRTGNVLNNDLMVNGHAVFGPGDIVPEASGLIVWDNDFSTGRVEIILGDYSIVSGVDFTIGATAHDTADNIAAAISRLPGFIATVPAGAPFELVVVEYDKGSADIVDFSICHYGTIVNLVDLSMMMGGDPAGQLFLGSPSPGGVALYP